MSPDNPQDTKGKLQQFAEYDELANVGGGEQAIKKQHSKGRLTARERISLLLDEGSFFQELGKLTKGSVDVFGDGVVTGFGFVNGRKIGIYAQDFTSQGGSIGEIHARKICEILDACTSYGIPIVGLNDSGGARILEGVSSLAGVADIFYRNVQASGVIPQIVAIMGPCAGGAAYSPALMDIVIMVQDQSFMFLTGPDVVKQALNEDVTAEELGGALVHNKQSGVAHLLATNELECIQYIKRLLSYLPSNNAADPPECSTYTQHPSMEDLATIIPDQSKTPYDMKNLLALVVDQDSLFEIQPIYAPNIITAFARIQGRVIGIVANQPKVSAGVLDIFSSRKAGGFIRFCDAFNIPVVTFQDVPGYLPGKGQEANGAIREGAKLLYAYCEATVPKIGIVVRKSYGGAHCVMSSKQVGADYNFAWPTAEIAVMDGNGAASIIHRREIAKLKTETARAKRLAKREIEYNDEYLNPWKAVNAGYIDEVIDPCHTRCRLIQLLEITSSKSVSPIHRKHGLGPM